MDGQKISVAELLAQVAGDLEEIEVPVKYGDRIARPLCVAVAQIRMCLEAIRMPEDKEETTQKEAEENG